MSSEKEESTTPSAAEDTTTIEKKEDSDEKQENPTTGEDKAVEGGDAKKEEKGGASGGINSSSNNNNNNNRRKRDEVNIEELFDLSKPIPRVPKPNKDEHEKALAEINEEFEKIKEERNKIQKQIDDIYEKNKKSGIGKEREALQQLRNKKGQLIDEKRAIRAKLDEKKNQADKIIKDKNNTKQNIKFTKLEDIQKEIQKLQRKQETTSMSLSEEKRLIKEIDALQASKKFVAELKDKETAFEDIREQRKSIGDSIKSKDKEIDAVTKQIDEKSAAIKQMQDKESNKRDTVQAAMKKRDEIKQKMTDKIKEKDELRAKFREKNNEWFNYQRAVKAQQKIKFDEEKKKREEEHQAYLKKMEEEEAKKIPYEEEQGLCDYLIEYLSRTYLNKNSSKDEDKKSADVVEVKDDPFAGMKPIGRKNQEEEMYFGKGKGKKKRVRAAKKQDQLAGPFTLSVDTFEQFGWIGLNPPTSVDMVEKSVEELKEKKEFYKKQPRGSVPTAAEIRKSNERAAAKIRKSNNGDVGPVSNGSSVTKPPTNGQTTKGFSLSNDDFVPLAGGSNTTTTSALNSSWGKAAAAPQSSSETASDEKEEEPSPKDETDKAEPPASADAKTEAAKGEVVEAA